MDKTVTVELKSDNEKELETETQKYISLGYTLTESKRNYAKFCKHVF
jgi:phosphate-selective porin